MYETKNELQLEMPIWNKSCASGLSLRGEQQFTAGKIFYKNQFNLNKIPDFLFFCIFLSLYNFSYHLKTVPAIKSAQGTYFTASKAGRKEPLSRKLVCFCKSCFSPFSYFTLFSASSFSRFYISLEEEGGSQGYF